MKKIVSFSLSSGLLLAFSVMAVPASATAADELPYTVVEGKVDKGTYNGYRRFHGICHTCHGPDGLGSTIGPNLIESLQTLTYEEFKETVMNGRTTTTPQGQPSVMPNFDINPDIVKYLDDIYGYLKARSDGVLARGKPQKIK